MCDASSYFDILAAANEERQLQMPEGVLFVCPVPPCGKRVSSGAMKSPEKMLEVVTQSMETNGDNPRNLGSEGRFAQ